MRGEQKCSGFVSIELSLSLRLCLTVQCFLTVIDLVKLWV